MAHPARLPIEQLLSDCEFRRTRRSGPGGQHRNKVETAVIVEHLPTGSRAEANETRSQDTNRQKAIHRLRIRLALEIRTSPALELTQLCQSRTANGKLAVNAEHADFPALLSEALDTLAELEFDLPSASSRLNITSSQLVKFLKIEPAALALVNRERQARGLSAYR
jgi:protein subunit release factor B